MSGSRKLGAAAEEAVVRYIEEERGWKVLAQNVSRPWGELDIVAQDQQTLVCVEVKAGQKGSPLAPEEHFDYRKRQKVERACGAYAVHHGFAESDCRVDLAALEVDGAAGRARIRYYMNVGRES